ncbi:MAG TPA: sigma-70 family RNA polymerase sigma factor, partial [Gemmataceae bacterium]|nr:sigma-70 family RNA polymerase sigma factor [Gemmataceae bacterium]
RSLLERVRRDDAAAWDRLVTLYAPLVWHWCRRCDLQEADQADIVQDVFQAVAAHIGTFRRERSGDTFRGWLRTITRNKVRDHYRRLSREPGGVGGTEAQQRLARVPDFEDGADDPPDVEAAERALFHRALELIRCEFEEKTWQAFWRTTVEGRSAAEVGEELGMRPGAVRVAKSRVLQRLREELGDLLP